eukprot:m51a1_g918 putative histidine acid phosphatase superfamily protein (430) ;mRNA; r:179550-181128
MLPALLVLVALAAAPLAAAKKDHTDLTGHFATGTPYSPGRIPASRAPTGYTVVGLSSVGRHGSRYPTSGTIKHIRKLGEYLEEHSDELSLKWMRKWRADERYDPELEGVLVERGTQELVGIGSRVTEQYASVLLPYNPNSVVSSATYKPRTCQSSIAFGLGAIKADGLKKMTWGVSEDAIGKELRFFDKCAAYLRDVVGNATLNAELRAYQDRAYAAVAPKLSAKTGISVKHLLKKDRVQTMWDLCVFDTLVYGDDEAASGWCSLFDEADAKALEFAEDLEKYLMSGYGVPLSYHIAAPLLQSIVKHLDELAAGSPVRARLRFAHCETVVPLLALLGLYRDEVPLTASMTQEQMDARVWRMSQIGKMATNVFFVLATSKDGEPLVQVLHNESPVVLAQVGCTDVWCPLSEIKKGYSRALDFNFDMICSK